MTGTGAKLIRDRGDLHACNDWHRSPALEGARGVARRTQACARSAQHRGIIHRMRILLAAFSVVLLVIALIGISIGAAIMHSAMKQPNAGTLAAFVVAAVPFLIGTVALGSVTVVFALEQSHNRLQDIAESSRTTARLLMQPHETDDPVLKAKRAREAADRARSPYTTDNR